MKTRSLSQSHFNLLIPICLVLCAIALSAHGATITVINTNHSGPRSLREALADPNDRDTINFAVTGTIGLTSGELLVDKSVTISGPGVASRAVDGNANSRVFHIGSGKTVSISALTLTNGNAASGYGGGFLNDHATLTILNSTLSGNGANFAGGGVYNDASDGGSATLTIINSIVSNNAVGFFDMFPTGGEGGGIYNGGGMITITNSSVSENSAGVPGPNFPTGAGGGISNYGTLTIASSTVSGNGTTGQHYGEPWGMAPAS